jgi:hypothetical protein
LFAAATADVAAPTPGLLPPAELLPLLLPLLLLALLASAELLEPVPWLALASPELQMVPLSAERLTETDADSIPRASPWVTFGKFNLTSPSDVDIRVTPLCFDPDEAAK